MYGASSMYLHQHVRQQSHPQVHPPEPCRLTRRAPAGRLQHRHLSQAFEAWCTFLEGRREAQDRAQAALQHWTLGRVAASWQAWRSFVAAKHTKEVGCPVGPMQHLQLPWGLRHACDLQALSLHQLQDNMQGPVADSFCV